MFSPDSPGSLCSEQKGGNGAVFEALVAPDVDEATPPGADQPTPPLHGVMMSYRSHYHAEARSRDMQEARRLVQSGEAAVDQLDGQGRTALHVLMEQGGGKQVVGMARVLLVELKANANLLDPVTGTGPLHKLTDTDLIKLAVQLGADVDLGGKFQLPDDGALVESRDRYQQAIADEDGSSRHRNKILAQTTPVANRERKAKSPSLTTTPLENALWRGWTEVANTLVDVGADISRVHDPEWRQFLIDWAFFRSMDPGVALRVARAFEMPPQDALSLVVGVIMSGSEFGSGRSLPKSCRLLAHLYLEYGGELKAATENYLMKMLVASDERALLRKLRAKGAELTGEMMAMAETEQYEFLICELGADPNGAVIPTNDQVSGPLRTSHVGRGEDDVIAWALICGRCEQRQRSDYKGLNTFLAAGWESGMEVDLHAPMLECAFDYENFMPVPRGSNHVDPSPDSWSTLHRCFTLEAYTRDE